MIRIHHWIASDDQRNFHDHAWDYRTFVLWGGYTDINPDGEIRMERWTTRKFPAEHKHTVKVDKGGCWTIMITGPERRTWGFWVKGKFRKRNKYFFEHGVHPCEK